MEKNDAHQDSDFMDDEYEMFLNEVIQGEHDLLFLDSYLKEALADNLTI